jgi:hypothetical protein
LIAIIIERTNKEVIIRLRKNLYPKLAFQLPLVANEGELVHGSPMPLGIKCG